MINIKNFYEYVTDEYINKLTDAEIMTIARDHDTDILYNEVDEFDNYFDKPSQLLTYLDNKYKSSDEFVYFDGYGYLCSTDNIYDIVDKSDLIDWLEEDWDVYNKYIDYVSNQLYEFTPQELLDELEYPTNETVKDVILDQYGDKLVEGLTEETARELYDSIENEDLKDLLLEHFNIENEINDKKEGR